jgi:hypothetical protein
MTLVFWLLMAALAVLLVRTLLGAGRRERTMTRWLLVLALLFPLLGCADEGQSGVRSPAGPTEPTPVPPPLPTVHTFVFQVVGPFDGPADITVVSTTEGTSQVQSTLPWFATIKSTRTQMFLSIEANGQGSGDLTVQIWVDGSLFREAVAQGDFPTAAVSGTWTAQ